MSARDDVKRLLAAAARIAKDDALIARLAESTGLSRENVVFGMTCLETASDAEIDALVAKSTRAAHVHVWLSASVFVAPLRAIALGLAAGAAVTVKPSRREPHFAHALVDAFGDARVALATDARVADITEGEIHVYGRDETIANVRRDARAGVVVRGHGAGMGVVLVTGDHDVAATSLADDVVVFDQRGCVSPRIAFVTGDGHAFAKKLFEVLEGTTIPRGALDDGEARARSMWTSSVAYAGALHEGASCAVGVADENLVPPSGRHVLVRALSSPRELVRALGAEARWVIVVGSDAPIAELRAFAPPHARLSALGAMQRPPLDGPVDVRGALR